MATEIALNHHENFDGTGYPMGLRGEVIPNSARMMAIVDVLTHKRVYKEAVSTDEAIKYIKDNRGKHFDPTLVDVFISNFEYIVVV